MNPNRLSKDQWSRYWRRDSITTFSRQFNENYDGEFQEFWEARFAELEDGARIVDLGTGNGAIPLLAVQFAEAHELFLAVSGLDFAQIHPKDVLGSHSDLEAALEKIEFLSRVPMESTGLPSGVVDLLTSQYGFEYADAHEAVKEARRVLKDDGTIALVLHHAESAVVKLAEDGLKQVEYCLIKEQLDKRVMALVRAMGTATTAFERRQLQHNPKTERLRQKINAAVARINDRAERYKDPEGFIGVVIPNLMNVFASYKDAPMEQKLKYVGMVRREFDSFKERMADLKDAALSKNDFEALVASFDANDFSIREQGQLHYGPQQDLMGWTLVADKRS